MSLRPAVDLADRRSGRRTGAIASFRQVETLLGFLDDSAGQPFCQELQTDRERPMAVLVVSTDAGDFAIQEHEILTITAAELCQLRISRADLRRLFAEAAKLLLGIKPRDQARLVVTRALDGHWKVHTDFQHQTAALEA